MYLNQKEQNEMTSKYIKFDAGLQRLLGCVYWSGRSYFRVDFYKTEEVQYEKIRSNGFRTCYSR